MANVYKVKKWKLNRRASNTQSIDGLLLDLRAKEYVVYTKSIHGPSLTEGTVRLIKLKDNNEMRSFFQIYRYVGNNLYVINSKESDGERSGGHSLGILNVFEYRGAQYELFFNWQNEETYLIAYSKDGAIQEDILELFTVEEELTSSVPHIHLLPYSWL